MNMRNKLLGNTAPIQYKSDGASDTPEAKTIRTMLEGVVHEERQRYEAMIAEAKKLGGVDPVAQASVKKLEAAYDEMEKKLEQVVLERSRTPIGNGNGDDTKAAQQFFDVKNALSSKSLLDMPAISAEEAKAYGDYTRVFAKFARLGADRDRLTDAEAKTLSLGTDPTGGYLAPATLSNEIIKRLFDDSPVRQIAGSITIGGQAFEWPLDVNDASSGGWVSEMQSRTVTGTPNLGMGRIPVHEQYAMPDASQQMLEDSILNIEQWLINKTTDKMLRTENAAFITGNGVGKPRGFLDYASSAVTTEDASRAWGALQYIFTGVSGDFAASSPADKLIDVVTKPKAAYLPGARWAFNRFTQAAVRKLKDGQGNYLWTAGIIPNGIPASLLGFPISILEDMPAIAANSFSMAFGDFNKGYLVVDRLGIALLRDPYSAKPKVQFYLRKRVGGDVVDFDALKLLKFGTS